MAKKKVEGYEGIKKVLDMNATLFREPVRKEDKFEHEGALITKVYRNGKLLYRLGKRKSIKPKGSYAEIVHIEVDPNPGRIDEDDAHKEGYGHPKVFRDAFEAEFGETALWRPAWRVEWEIHMVVKEKDEIASQRDAALPRNDKNEPLGSDMSDPYGNDKNDPIPDPSPGSGEGEKEEG